MDRAERAQRDRAWPPRERPARDPETAPEVLAQWVRELQAEDAIRRAEAEGRRQEQERNRTSYFPTAIYDLWSSREYVSWGLAENPSTPPDALLLLADDFDPSVRFAACSNPSFPRVELERLVAAGLVEARAAAAALVQEPLLGLIDWASDPDFRVRRAVAGNPNTPSDVLMALSVDPSWQVVAAAAGNSSLPEHRLRQLARFQDWHVRAAAAGNPSAPADLIGALARDERWEVGRAARNHPNLPEEDRAELRAAAEAARLAAAVRKTSDPEARRFAARKASQWRPGDKRAAPAKRVKPPPEQ